MIKFDQITDNLYAITDGSTIGNVGLIVNNGKVSVIDASMYPLMGSKIRKKGATYGNIENLIITHYHFDHIGGIQAFSDLPIISSSNTYDNMKKALNNQWKPSEISKFINSADEKTRELFEGFKIETPNKTFENNINVGNFSVKHVGGHTSGSSLIFYDDDRAVFAGDNLFIERYPWGGDPSADPYKWVNIFAEIIEYKPKIIIPGHGPVIFSLDPIKEYMKYFNKIITLCENNIVDGVDKENIIDDLFNIDFLPVKNKEAKRKTIEHFYTIIKDKIENNKKDLMK